MMILTPGIISMIIKMKKYYSIDHKWLFLFGYFFYLFVPLLAGSLNIFRGFPGMDLYQGFFKQVPQAQLQLYILITISWFFAFYSGHFCCKLFFRKKKNLLPFAGDSADYGLNFIGSLLMIVLILFAYMARNSILSGYASYDIAARGKLSTLLVLYNFFIIYQLVSVRKVSTYFTVGAFICALLLLSMGGRMYVFQTLIIIVVYKTSFAKKRWSFLQILLVVIAGFGIGSLAGIWRLKSSYSLAKATYSFLAEPIFTWISTGTLLAANKIPLINFPVNFLTSFLNLVPNTFISLRPYVVSSQQMGYHYLSPLGADSIWVNVIINFGAIGSLVFIFLTGFMLNFLRHLSEKNRFAAAYYILVCSILPFQFFRDGFYLLNKQLFFNFLLLPGMMLVLLRLVKYLHLQAKLMYTPKPLTNT
jgi:hypothetical protein